VCAVWAMWAVYAAGGSDPAALAVMRVMLDWIGFFWLAEMIGTKDKPVPPDMSIGGVRGRGGSGALHRARDRTSFGSRASSK